MKKIVVMCAVALTAVALASTVVRAKGNGAVTNNAGQRGEFLMDVWKEINGDHVSVGGNARFATSIRRADGVEGRRYIELAQVTTVNKSGRSLVAYGRGAMYISYPNRPAERVEGYVRVNVEDRKTAGGLGEPDRFSIRFQAAATALVYEFGGLVRPGDVAVN